MKEQIEHDQKEYEKTMTAFCSPMLDNFSTPVLLQCRQFLPQDKIKAHDAEVERLTIQRKKDLEEKRKLEEKRQSDEHKRQQQKTCDDIYFTNKQAYHNNPGIVKGMPGCKDWSLPATRSSP
jgi:hypothetical protein